MKIETRRRGIARKRCKIKVQSMKIKYFQERVPNTDNLVYG